MPLATNPNAIFIITLESDRELPEEKQPKFHYRYLTGLQQMELARSMDELESAKTGSEAILKIFEKAATGLVGWTNIYDDKGQAITFGADKLSAIMGITEANEIIAKLLRQFPTVGDKKKSESPSQSSTDKSAKAVKEK